MKDMNKEKYKITLIGCDDITIIPVELTDEEHELIREISEKSKQTSTYGCMPVMVIEVEEI